MCFPLVTSGTAACGPTVLKYQFKTSQGLSASLQYPTERNIHLRVDPGTTGVANTMRKHSQTLSENTYTISAHVFCWKEGIRP